MTVDETLINKIIRDVLKQIRSGSVPTRTATSTTTQTLQLIDDEVITGETLSSQLQDGAKITIGAKSVITPTGRDFLKAHHISWSRGSSSSETSTENATWNIIISDFTPSLQSTLPLFLQRNGSHQQELADNPADAASRAISSVCRSNHAGVILFSQRAEVVSCLANRNNQVRAAVVQNVQHWKEIKQHLNSNVCCINPAGRSSYEIQNLLNQITQ